MDVSNLQKARYDYRPKLPQVFENHGPSACIEEKDSKTENANRTTIRDFFPNTVDAPVVSFADRKNASEQSPINVAIIFSGGQAPGGHNVVAGLHAAIKQMNSQSRLFGFIGGPSGLVENHYMELTEETVKHYLNTGGFEMIQSGRTKPEEQ